MVNEGIPQVRPIQLLPELRINFKINALNAHQEPSQTELNSSELNITILTEYPSIRLPILASI